MTTYAELIEDVSRDLGDDDNQTFTEPMVRDFIRTGLTEVGRVAPRHFQEDVTAVEATLEYQLQADEFNDVLVPEIEVYLVEVWDGNFAPPMPVKHLSPRSREMTTSYESGWNIWGGVLELPRSDFMTWIAGREDARYIRVWGYSPYPPFGEDDGDTVPVSYELEQAIRLYAQIEGIRRLQSSRDLYTQWQTRSNNADVSPAGLANQFNILQEEWRRKAKAIFVTRARPD